ncbi:site-specific integrase [Rubrivirga sp. SAORIC476]|uniref:tyrosine-type recombinase/integrase n=1 Tax=Rubrivirga sp. SAORIC476 TaxID=1961794 RepID=UPI001304415D|nr:site-specific integrase [Rubrivirga sp. SAORIC476]
MSRALEHARDRSLGTFDPWGQAASTGVSVTEAAAAYIASQKRAGRAEGTVNSAERLLSAFERSLPAGCNVAHVEPMHVERFVSAPKPGKEGKPGPPKSAGTRRRYRAVLRHFFAFCQRRGYTRTDPTADLEAPTGRANRRDHVTEAEAAKMLRTLDAAEVLDGRSYGWLRDWLVFGMGTGLRPGEQAGLRWSDVRLSEGALRVRGTKTSSSARPVPVAGDALAVLRQRSEARADESDSLVFVGSRGGAVEMRHLSKRLNALAESAKVKKNVTAYSLRHSYGTRMAAAGVPLLDLARIMGTSVAMIERHYGHYCPERGAAHVLRVFGTEAMASTSTSV